ncbi:DHA2 family efflux MFS transporter permease subunit [Erwinia typographi]|uniref:DHA2 family efflux MFS transporter permease subunit n=1 Tax=Erwinia typographi TaxID=371042 RepID=UPI000907BC5E|nr:DHA2 family efflux MFS transporter permease subunit [Erwinia typographi]
MKIKKHFITRVALSISAFVVVMDSTITNVSTSVISGSLGMSMFEGGLISSVFGLSNALSIPLMKLLSSTLGEKKTYIFSFLLFVLSSIFCGLSLGMFPLLFFRVIQGVSSGPIIPLSLSILLSTYRKKDRTSGVSLWSSIVVIAPAVGPVIGGVICKYLSWRWLFFINAPVGLICLNLLFKDFFSSSKDDTASSDCFDILGYFSVSIFMILWQVIISHDNSFSFDNPLDFYLVFLCILFLFLFFISQIYGENPMFDVSLFLNKNYLIGTVCLSCSYLINLSTVLPIFLIEVHGYDLLSAGLACASAGIPPLLISSKIKKIMSIVNPKHLVFTGFVLYAVCLHWRTSMFQTNTSFESVCISQFFIGVASTLFFIPITDITISYVKRKRIGSALTLNCFCKTICSAIGTSITYRIWNSRLFLHTSRLSDSVNYYSELFRSENSIMISKGLSYYNSLSFIKNEILVAGKIESINDLFFCGVILNVILACVILMSTSVEKYPSPY